MGLDERGDMFKWDGNGWHFYKVVLDQRPGGRRESLVDV
jgi:hypothetical protein